MQFEFDDQKSAANKTKHGIDCTEAQALWSDQNRLELSSSFADEKRFLIIGLIDAKHWSAIVTYRGEMIRLISVRRSREEERACYESL